MGPALVVKLLLMLVVGPVDYLQLGIYKNPIGPTLFGYQYHELGSAGNLLDDVAAKY